MKVCIIHSIFPPYSRGGAEMVAFATARAFTDAGHDVFVITCAPFEGGKSLAGKWESNANLRIFRFTPLNLFTIFNIGKYPALLRLIWHVIDMFNPHSYLVVKKILAREKPDLIITRNLKGLGYTVPIAIKNVKCKIKNIVWFHGLHDLGALDPRGFMEWGKESVIRAPSIVIKLYREITKRLFGSPDAIIAPSRFVLDEYNHAGFFVESKKVVVHNPVLHNPSQPTLILRGGDDSITPLKIRGDGGVMMRFLYIGQLEPYKGIRVLLDAWKKFIVDHPDARLEIAGTGSLEEEVRRAVEHVRGIQYHGFVSHGLLFSLLHGARATILPTLAYETFGLSIIESFAAGVPVIVSRIGATAEIVQDGMNGYLVAPNDSGALCDAFAKMMEPSQQELAQRAKKSAEQYTLDKYYTAFYQMCTSLT